MKNHGGLRKRITLFVVIMMLVAGNTGFIRSESKTRINIPLKSEMNLYAELRLSDLGLNEDIFDKGLKGWQYLKNNSNLQRQTFLTIADFSQSSNAKRLYVIDLEKKKVVFNTYVSHGRNSGEEFAGKFGNESESHKSSLGFYLTGPVYIGAHGTSMKLYGLEKGFNHLAEERGIVVHGASYVSESFIRENGRLGRSLGCPAVSEKDCLPIITSIKEGSCFFVFYPDSSYLRRSAFCN